MVLNYLSVAIRRGRDWNPKFCGILNGRKFVQVFNFMACVNSSYEVVAFAPVIHRPIARDGFPYCDVNFITS